MRKVVRKNGSFNDTFQTDMKNTETQQGLKIFLMNCLLFKFAFAFAFLMEWDNRSEKKI